MTGKDRTVDGMHAFAKEVERTGKARLHNVGAFMGGVAAQEVVKVVVEQYTPLSNVMVYDGVGARAGVFEL